MEIKRLLYFFLVAIVGSSYLTWKFYLSKYVEITNSKNIIKSDNLSKLINMDDINSEPNFDVNIGDEILLHLFENQ